jgi:hypothetical protein
VWSVLFYNGDVNGYVISGVIILLAGLIIVNIPKKAAARVTEIPLQAAVNGSTN